MPSIRCPGMCSSNGASMLPAGFEGGTSIYINPMTPIELRDKMVPRLYKLRDEGKIGWLRIAEECRVDPNPLKYYFK